MDITQRRFKFKKPIFDEYPTNKSSSIMKMSQSIGYQPISQQLFKSQQIKPTSNFQETPSLTNSFIATPQRRKERIFQYQKVPLKIQQNSLIDLRSSSLNQSMVFKDFENNRDQDNHMPIHFQIDEITQRQLEDKSAIKKDFTDEQMEKKNNQQKSVGRNDKFAQLGAGIIILLLIIIGLLKWLKPEN